MARPKKSDMVATEDTVVTETKTTETNAEVERLQKENENLKAQFEELKALISNQNNTSANTVPVSTGSKYIKVVSLYDGILNMYTGEQCSGKLFTFTSVGQSTKILNQELRDLIRVNLGFFEKGYCYICDSEFVSDVGLEESYKNIIDPETFIDICNGTKSDEAISIYETANEDQKKTIMDVAICKVAEKKLPKKFLDVLDPDGKYNLKEKSKDTENMIHDYQEQAEEQK